jgi:5'-deoxynucleotidase YfbR-like HD superfamily hydrolase
MASLSNHEGVTQEGRTMARGKERAWQRMLSGRRLDLLDPSPLDVELSDIAHGLARVARWNGQTLGDYPFSVAQHSVLVLEIFRALSPEADAKSQLYAVLHDAPEYVMGDIISPFKAAMGGNYKEVEDRLLGAVHVRFALPAIPAAALRRQIKQADREAAYLEAVHLAGFGAEEARKFFGEPSFPHYEFDGFERLIRPWPTREAFDRFVAAVEDLAALLPG